MQKTARYSDIYIILTPLHFIVSYNMYLRGGVAQQKKTLFVVVDNFNFLKILNILNIKMPSDRVKIFPGDRHSNRFIRVGRTLFSYSLSACQSDNVFIFNDSSFRVQSFLSRITSNRVILVEEGLAPYAAPTFRHNYFHRAFASISKKYISCDLGFSGLYDHYFIVNPEKAYKKLDRDKIKKIDVEFFKYDSGQEIHRDEIVLITSPVYDNVNELTVASYLSQIELAINEIKRPIYFKFHPLERPSLYSSLVERYSDFVTVLNPVLPTNCFLFDRNAILVSFSMSSAFQYADCKKYLINLAGYDLNLDHDLLAHFNVSVLGIADFLYEVF